MEGSNSDDRKRWVDLASPATGSNDSWSQDFSQMRPRWHQNYRWSNGSTDTPEYFDYLSWQPFPGDPIISEPVTFIEEIEEEPLEFIEERPLPYPYPMIEPFEFVDTVPFEYVETVEVESVPVEVESLPVVPSVPTPVAPLALAPVPVLPVEPVPVVPVPVPVPVPIHLEPVEIVKPVEPWILEPLPYYAESMTTETLSKKSVKRKAWFLPTCCLVLACWIVLVIIVLIPIIFLLLPKEPIEEIMGKVGGALTLEKLKYDDKLSDKSSPEFQILADIFEEEMRLLYDKNDTAYSYRDSRVNNFTNGRVGIDYDLYFGATEHEIPTNETLKEILYSVDRDKNDTGLGVLGDLRFRIDDVFIEEPIKVIRVTKGDEEEERPLNEPHKDAQFKSKPKTKSPFDIGNTLPHHPSDFTTTATTTTQTVKSTTYPSPASTETIHDTPLTTSAQTSTDESRDKATNLPHKITTTKASKGTAHLPESTTIKTKASTKRYVPTSTSAMPEHSTLEVLPESTTIKAKTTTDAVTKSTTTAEDVAETTKKQIPTTTEAVTKSITTTEVVTETTTKPTTTEAVTDSTTVGDSTTMEAVTESTRVTIPVTTDTVTDSTRLRDSTTMEAVTTEGEPLTTTEVATKSATVVTPTTTEAVTERTTTTNTQTTAEYVTTVETETTTFDYYYDTTTDYSTDEMTTEASSTTEATTENKPVTIPTTTEVLTEATTVAQPTTTEAVTEATAVTKPTTTDVVTEATTVTEQTTTGIVTEATTVTEPTTIEVVKEATTVAKPTTTEAAMREATTVAQPTTSEVVTESTTFTQPTTSEVVTKATAVTKPTTTEVVTEATTLPEQTTTEIVTEATTVTEPTTIEVVTDATTVAKPTTTEAAMREATTVAQPTTSEVVTESTTFTQLNTTGAVTETPTVAESTTTEVVTEATTFTQPTTTEAVTERTTTTNTQTTAEYVTTVETETTTFDYYYDTTTDYSTDEMTTEASSTTEATTENKPVTIPTTTEVLTEATTVAQPTTTEAVTKATAVTKPTTTEVVTEATTVTEQTTTEIVTEATTVTEPTTIEVVTDATTVAKPTTTEAAMREATTVAQPTTSEVVTESTTFTQLNTAGAVTETTTVAESTTTEVVTEATTFTQPITTEAVTERTTTTNTQTTAEYVTTVETETTTFDYYYDTTTDYSTDEMTTEASSTTEATTANKPVTIPTTTEVVTEATTVAEPTTKGAVTVATTVAKPTTTEAVTVATTVAKSTTTEAVTEATSVAQPTTTEVVTEATTVTEPTTTEVVTEATTVAKPTTTEAAVREGTSVAQPTTTEVVTEATTVADFTTTDDVTEATTVAEPTTTEFVTEATTVTEPTTTRAVTETTTVAQPTTTDVVTEATTVAQPTTTEVMTVATTVTEPTTTEAVTEATTEAQRTTTEVVTEAITVAESITTGVLTEATTVTEPTTAEAVTEVTTVEESTTTTGVMQEATTVTEPTTTEAVTEATTVEESTTITEAVTEATTVTEPTTTEAVTNATMIAESTSTGVMTDATTVTEPTTTEAVTESTTVAQPTTTEVMTVATTVTEPATTEAVTEATTEAQRTTTEVVTEATTVAESITTGVMTEATTVTEPTTTEAVTNATSVAESITTGVMTDATTVTEPTPAEAVTEATTVEESTTTTGVMTEVTTVTEPTTAEATTDATTVEESTATTGVVTEATTVTEPTTAEAVTNATTVARSTTTELMTDATTVTEQTTIEAVTEATTVAQRITTDVVTKVTTNTEPTTSEVVTEVTTVTEPTTTEAVTEATTVHESTITTGVMTEATTVTEPTTAEAVTEATTVEESTTTTGVVTEATSVTEPTTAEAVTEATTVEESTATTGVMTEATTVTEQTTIEAVTEATTVAQRTTTKVVTEVTTNTEPTTTEAVTEATTVEESTTTEPVTEATTVAESNTTEAMTEATTVAQPTTTEPVTEATTVAESNTTAAMTEATTVAESNTTEAMTEATTVAESTTTKAVTEATTVTEPTTTKALTEATTVTVQTTTQAVTEATTVTEPTTTGAVTEATTVTEPTTTEAVTEATTVAESNTTEAMPEATTVTKSNTTDAVTEATTVTQPITTESVTEATTIAESITTEAMTESTTVTQPTTTDAVTEVTTVTEPTSKEVVTEATTVTESTTTEAVTMTATVTEPTTTKAVTETTTVAESTTTEAMTNATTVAEPTTTEVVTEANTVAQRTTTEVVTEAITVAESITTEAMTEATTVAQPTTSEVVTKVTTITEPTTTEAVTEATTVAESTTTEAVTEASTEAESTTTEATTVTQPTTTEATTVTQPTTTEAVTEVTAVTEPTTKQVVTMTTTVTEPTTTEAVTMTATVTEPTTTNALTEATTVADSTTTEFVTEATTVTVPNTTEAVTEATNVAEPTTTDVVTEATTVAEPTTTGVLSEANTVAESTTTEAMTRATTVAQRTTAEVATEATTLADPVTSETATDSTTVTQPSTTEAMTEETQLTTSEVVTDVTAVTQPTTTEVVTDVTTVAKPTTTETVTEATTVTQPTTSETLTEGTTVSKPTTTEAVTEATSVTKPTTTETVTEATTVTQPTTSETVTEATTVSKPTTTEAVTEATTVTEPTTTGAMTEATTIAKPTTTEAVTEATTVPEPTTTEAMTEATTIAKPTTTKAVTEATTVTEPTTTKALTEATTVTVQTTTQVVTEATTVAQPTTTGIVTEATTVARPTTTEDVTEATTVTEPTATEVMTQSSTVTEPTTTEVVKEATTVVQPTNIEVVTERTTVTEPVTTEVITERTTVTNPTTTEAVTERTTVTEPATAEVVTERTTVTKPTTTEAVTERITLIVQTTTEEVTEGPTLTIPTTKDVLKENTTVTAPITTENMIEHTTVTTAAVVTESTTVTAPTTTENVTESSTVTAPTFTEAMTESTNTPLSTTTELLTEPSSATPSTARTETPSTASTGRSVIFFTPSVKTTNHTRHTTQKSTIGFVINQGNNTTIATTAVSAGQTSTNTTTSEGLDFIHTRTKVPPTGGDTGDWGFVTNPGNGTTSATTTVSEGQTSSNTTTSDGLDFIHTRTKVPPTGGGTGDWGFVTNPGNGTTSATTTVSEGQTSVNTSDGLDFIHTRTKVPPTGGGTGDWGFVTNPGNGTTSATTAVSEGQTSSNTTTSEGLDFIHTRTKVPPTGGGTGDWGFATNPGNGTTIATTAVSEGQTSSNTTTSEGLDFIHTRTKVPPTGGDTGDWGFVTNRGNGTTVATTTVSEGQTSVNTTTSEGLDFIHTRTKVPPTGGDTSDWGFVTNPGNGTTSATTTVSEGQTSVNTSDGLDFIHTRTKVPPTGGGTGDWGFVTNPGNGTTSATTTVSEGQTSVNTSDGLDFIHTRTKVPPTGGGTGDWGFVTNRGNGTTVATTTVSEGQTSGTTETSQTPITPTTNNPTESLRHSTINLTTSSPSVANTSDSLLTISSDQNLPTTPSTPLSNSTISSEDNTTVDNTTFSLPPLDQTTADISLQSTASQTQEQTTASSSLPSRTSQTTPSVMTTTYHPDITYLWSLKDSDLTTLIGKTTIKQPDEDWTEDFLHGSTVTSSSTTSGGPFITVGTSVFTPKDEFLAFNSTDNAGISITGLPITTGSPTKSPSGTSSVSPSGSSSVSPSGSSSVSPTGSSSVSPSGSSSVSPSGSSSVSPTGSSSVSPSGTSSVSPSGLSSVSPTGTSSVSPSGTSSVSPSGSSSVSPTGSSSVSPSGTSSVSPTGSSSVSPSGTSSVSPSGTSSVSPTGSSSVSPSGTSSVSPTRSSSVSPSGTSSVSPTGSSSVSPSGSSTVSPTGSSSVSPSGTSSVSQTGSSSESTSSSSSVSTLRSSSVSTSRPSSVSTSGPSTVSTSGASSVSSTGSSSESPSSSSVSTSGPSSVSTSGPSLESTSGPSFVSSPVSPSVTKRITVTIEPSTTTEIPLTQSTKRHDPHGIIITTPSSTSTEVSSTMSTRKSTKEAVSMTTSQTGSDISSSTTRVIFDRVTTTARPETTTSSHGTDDDLIADKFRLVPVRFIIPEPEPDPSLPRKDDPLWVPSAPDWKQADIFSWVGGKPIIGSPVSFIWLMRYIRGWKYITLDKTYEDGHKENISVITADDPTTFPSKESPLSRESEFRTDRAKVVLDIPSVSCDDEATYSVHVYNKDSHINRSEHFKLFGKPAAKIVSKGETKVVSKIDCKADVGYPAGLVFILVSNDAGEHMFYPVPQNAITYQVNTTCQKVVTFNFNGNYWNPINEDEVTYLQCGVYNPYGHQPEDRLALSEAIKITPSLDGSTDPQPLIFLKPLDLQPLDDENLQKEPIFKDISLPDHERPAMSTDWKEAEILSWSSGDVMVGEPVNRVWVARNIRGWKYITLERTYPDGHSDNITVLSSNMTDVPSLADLNIEPNSEFGEDMARVVLPIESASCTDEAVYSVKVVSDLGELNQAEHVRVHKRPVVKISATTLSTEVSVSSLDQIVCTADLGQPPGNMVLKITQDRNSNAFYYAPREAINVASNSLCQRKVFLNFSDNYWKSFNATNETYVQCGVYSPDSRDVRSRFVVSDALKIVPVVDGRLPVNSTDVPTDGDKDNVTKPTGGLEEFIPIDVPGLEDLTPITPKVFDWKTADLLSWLSGDMETGTDVVLQWIARNIEGWETIVLQKELPDGSRKNISVATSDNMKIQTVAKDMNLSAESEINVDRARLVLEFPTLSCEDEGVYQVNIMMGRNIISEAENVHVTRQSDVKVSPPNAAYINYDMDNVTCVVEIANSADLVFLKVTGGINNDTYFYRVPESFMREKINQTCPTIATINFRGGYWKPISEDGINYIQCGVYRPPIRRKHAVIKLSKHITLLPDKDSVGTREWLFNVSSTTDKPWVTTDPSKDQPGDMNLLWLDRVTVLPPSLVTDGPNWKHAEILSWHSGGYSIGSPVNVSWLTRNIAGWKQMVLDRKFPDGRVENISIIDSQLQKVTTFVDDLMLSPRTVYSADKARITLEIPALSCTDEALYRMNVVSDTGQINSSERVHVLRESSIQIHYPRPPVIARNLDQIMCDADLGYPPGKVVIRVSNNEHSSTFYYAPQRGTNVEYVEPCHHVATFNFSEAFRPASTDTDVIYVQCGVYNPSRSRMGHHIALSQTIPVYLRDTSRVTGSGTIPVSMTTRQTPGVVRNVTQSSSVTTRTPIDVPVFGGPTTLQPDVFNEPDNTVQPEILSWQSGNTFENNNVSITWMATNINGWSNLSIHKALKDGTSERIVSVKHKGKIIDSAGKLSLSPFSTLQPDRAHVIMPIPLLSCADEGTYTLNILQHGGEISRSEDIHMLRRPSVDIINPFVEVSTSNFNQIVCKADLGYPEGMLIVKVSTGNDSYVYYRVPDSVTNVSSSSPCKKLANFHFRAGYWEPIKGANKSYIQCGVYNPTGTQPRLRLVLSEQVEIPTEGSNDGVVVIPGTGVPGTGVSGTGITQFPDATPSPTGTHTGGLQANTFQPAFVTPTAPSKQPEIISWMNGDMYLGKPVTLTWMATDIEGWDSIILDREYTDGRHEDITLVRTDTMTIDNTHPYLAISHDSDFKTNMAKIILNITSITCNDEAVYTVNIHKQSGTLHRSETLDVFREPNVKMEAPVLTRNMSNVRCTADLGYPTGSFVMRVSDEQNSTRFYYVPDNLIIVQEESPCVKIVSFNFTDHLSPESHDLDVTYVQCGVYNPRSVQSQSGFVLTDIAEVLPVLPNKTETSTNQSTDPRSPWLPFDHNSTNATVKEDPVDIPDNLTSLSIGSQLPFDIPELPVWDHPEITSWVSGDPMIGNALSLTWMAHGIGGWRDIGIDRQYTDGRLQNISNINFDSMTITVNNRNVRVSPESEFLQEKAKVVVLIESLTCDDEAVYTVHVRSEAGQINKSENISVFRKPVAELSAPDGNISATPFDQITCRVNTGHPEGMMVVKVFDNNGSAQYYHVPKSVIDVQSEAPCNKVVNFKLEGRYWKPIENSNVTYIQCGVYNPHVNRPDMRLVLSEAVLSPTVRQPTGDQPFEFMNLHPVVQFEKPRNERNERPGFNGDELTPGNRKHTWKNAEVLSWLSGDAYIDQPVTVTWIATDIPDWDNIKLYRIFPDGQSENISYIESDNMTVVNYNNSMSLLPTSEFNEHVALMHLQIPSLSCNDEADYIAEVKSNIRNVSKSEPLNIRKKPSVKIIAPPKATSIGNIMCAADLGYPAGNLVVRVSREQDSTKFYYAPQELIQVQSNTSCQTIVTFNFTGNNWNITEGSNTYIQCGVYNPVSYKLNSGLILSDTIQPILTHTGGSGGTGGKDSGTDIHGTKTMEDLLPPTLKDVQPGFQPGSSVNDRGTPSSAFWPTLGFNSAEEPEVLSWLDGDSFIGNPLTITWLAGNIDGWKQIAVERALVRGTVENISVIHADDLNLTNKDGLPSELMGSEFSDSTAKLVLSIPVLNCSDEGVYTVHVLGLNSTVDRAENISVFRQPDARLVVPDSLSTSNFDRVVCQADLGYPAGVPIVKVYTINGSSVYYLVPDLFTDVTSNTSCQTTAKFNLTGLFWKPFDGPDASYIQCGVYNPRNVKPGSRLVLSDAVQTPPASWLLKHNTGTGQGGHDDPSSPEFSGMKPAMSIEDMLRDNTLPGTGSNPASTIGTQSDVADFSQAEMISWVDGNEVLGDPLSLTWMGTGVRGWQTIVVDREFADGRKENISIGRTDTMTIKNIRRGMKLSPGSEYAEDRINVMLNLSSLSCDDAALYSLTLSNGSHQITTSENILAYRTPRVSITHPNTSLTTFNMDQIMCEADLGYPANNLVIKVTSNLTSDKYYYAPEQFVKSQVNSTCQKIVTFNFTGNFWETIDTSNQTYIQCGVYNPRGTTPSSMFVLSDVVQVHTDGKQSSGIGSRSDPFTNNGSLHISPSDRIPRGDGTSNTGNGSSLSAETVDVSASAGQTSHPELISWVNGDFYLDKPLTVTWIAKNLPSWQDIVVNRMYSDGRTENISVIQTDTMTATHGKKLAISLTQSSFSSNAAKIVLNIPSLSCEDEAVYTAYVLGNTSSLNRSESVQVRRQPSVEVISFMSPHEVEGIDDIGCRVNLGHPPGQLVLRVSEINDPAGSYVFYTVPEEVMDIQMNTSCDHIVTFNLTGGYWRPINDSSISNIQCGVFNPNSEQQRFVLSDAIQSSGDGQNIQLPTSMVSDNIIGTRDQHAASIPGLVSDNIIGTRDQHAASIPGLVSNIITGASEQPAGRTPGLVSDIITGASEQPAGRTPGLVSNIIRETGHQPAGHNDTDAVKQFRDQVTRFLNRSGMPMDISNMSNEMLLNYARTLFPRLAGLDSMALIERLSSILRNGSMSKNNPTGLLSGLMQDNNNSKILSNSAGTLNLDLIQNLDLFRNMGGSNATNSTGTFDLDLIQNLDLFRNMGGSNATNSTGTLDLDLIQNLDLFRNMGGSNATNSTGTLDLDLIQNLDLFKNMGGSNATNSTGTLNSDFMRNLDLFRNMAGNSATNVTDMLNMPDASDGVINGLVTSGLVNSDTTGMRTTRSRIANLLLTKPPLRVESTEEFESLLKDHKLDNLENLPLTSTNLDSMGITLPRNAGNRDQATVPTVRLWNNSLGEIFLRSVDRNRTLMDNLNRNNSMFRRKLSIDEAGLDNDSSLSLNDNNASIKTFLQMLSSNGSFDDVRNNLENVSNSVLPGFKGNNSIDFGNKRELLVNLIPALSNISSADILKILNSTNHQASIFSWMSSKPYIRDPITMTWIAKDIIGWNYIVLEKSTGNLSEYVAVIDASTMNITYGDIDVRLSPDTEYDQNHARIVVDIPVLSCMHKANYTVLVVGNNISINSTETLDVFKEPSVAMVNAGQRSLTDDFDGVTCQADLGYPPGKLVLKVREQNGTVQNYIVPENRIDYRSNATCDYRVSYNVSVESRRRSESSKVTYIQCGVHNPDMRHSDTSFVLSSNTMLTVPGDICGRDEMGRIQHPYEQCAYIDCFSHTSTLCPVGTCFDTLSSHCV